MNIVLEKRQEVIQNNNTAQQQLEDILENYSKQSKELRIREPLHGDLDLSVLSDFGNISALYFVEGEITSIRSIPPRIAVLECPKNMLLEMPDELPPVLVRLQLSHNYLSKVGFASVPLLKQVLLEDNKIESIEDLPTTLEELDLAQNKLTRLDLGGLTQLKKLNLSNNPITVVENMVSHIAEFRMENTPTIDFRHLAEDAAATLAEGIRDGARVHIADVPKNYKEALDTYFRLKTKYEKGILDNKKKIYAKVGSLKDRASIREARRKVAEMKPKCIHCERPVGTVFSKKDGHYLAICGDAADPCPLSIDIFCGSSSPITSMLNLFQEDVLRIKESIIEQKMNILFNYISEDKCVSLFNKQMKLFQEDGQIVKEIDDTYREHFDNEYKKKTVVEKKNEIFSAIEKSRGLLTEYKSSGNRAFLQEAVHIQVNEILPEVKVIRGLENEIVEMQKRRTLDDKGPYEYELFKYPALLTKMDYMIGEKERVIKMKI